jgi:hypothetical protein
MEIITIGDVFVTTKIFNLFGKDKILLYHTKTRLWCNGDYIYKSDALEKILLRKINEQIVRTDLAALIKDHLP